MLAGTDLTTFAFDGNGNLQSENTAPSGVTTYTWDALDRLASVLVPGGTPTTYAYRYDGLRASQNTGSGVQTSVWDVPGPTGFGDLFEELDSGNNLLRAYYRAADLAAQKDANGTYAFHLIDQGTVQLLTNAAATITQTYQFGAWGELFASSGTVATPQSWNGRWGYYRDTSSRTWVRARHLDVLRGRWLSRDPLRFAGGPNLYAYAAAKPVDYIDPGGRVAIVYVSGNSITIYIPVRFSGPGDTMPREHLFYWGVHHWWTRRVGQFNVRAFAVPPCRFPGIKPNVIHLRNDKKYFRSYVDKVGGRTVELWQGYRTPLDNAFTAAHEAGHLMGQIDLYKDVNGVSQPFPGTKGDIMSTWLGTPSELDIDAILIARSNVIVNQPDPAHASQSGPPPAKPPPMTPSLFFIYNTGVE